MAFDASNIYSRVHDWVADRVAGVKIRADRMDAEFDGIATALTALGQNTLDPVNPYVSTKGNATAPGITFLSDLDTGIASLGDDQIEFVANGVVQLSVTTSGVDGVIGGTTPAAGTFTTATITTADINGGAIDGTTIGASSAAEGSFTNVDLTGELTTGRARATVAGGPTGPSYRWDSALTTGMYLNGTFVSFAHNGTASARFDDAGTTALATTTVITREKGDARYLALSGGTMTGAITSVDINSGAIDGTTIGASTSAAGTFSIATVEGTFPRLRMDDTDGTTNAKKWQQDIASGIMFLRPVDDSYAGSGTDYYRFNRSISLSDDQDVVVRGTGDARYLSDTRLGTERTTTSSLPAGVAGTLAVTAPSGSAITSVSIEKDASGEVLELIVKDRPVQKYVSGAWTTVSVV